MQQFFNLKMNLYVVWIDDDGIKMQEISVLAKNTTRTMTATTTILQNYFNIHSCFVLCV